MNSPEATSAGAPVFRPLWWDIFHVSVMYAFAVAQPALGQLGNREAFVIDVGLNRAGLFLLLTLVLFGIPVVLGLCLWMANRLSRPLREGMTLSLVLLFATMIALPVYRQYSLLTGLPMVLVAVGSAVAATWGFHRSRQVRSVVTLASVGYVLFPALFLSQTPASKAVLGVSEAGDTMVKPTPIVFVVFDEFSGLSLMSPDRSINAQRYPRFAELAQRTTWYRNATTVNSTTQCVVPVILSGKYHDPTSSHGVSRFDQHLFSMVMGTGGYEMVAFEPVSRLAFDGTARAEWQKPSIAAQLRVAIPEVAKAVLWNVTPREIRSRLPNHRQIWWGVPEGGITDRTLRRGVVRWGWSCLRVEQFQHFLDCLPEEGHPALHFMHLVFPHVPWMYLPSGRPYADECGDLTLLNFDTEGLAGDVWSDDPDFVERQEQRYLLQVQLADKMIGDLIDRLESLGMWDECLLIVTADHGVSFRAGQNRRHFSGKNADEIMSVPLFVKLPGQKSGSVSDRNVESVDLIPTVADVLQLPLKSPVDGESLAKEPTGRRTHKTLTENYDTLKMPVNVTAVSSIPEESRRRFGETRDDLFRFGPHAELIGQPVVDRVDQSDKADGVLELTRNSPEPFVLPEAPLPCYFEGIYRRANSDEEMPAIAVAINGTVQAIARPSALKAVRGRWESLVPEKCLNNGPNEAKFYVVRPVGEDLRLIPCETKQGAPRVIPD